MIYDFAIDMGIIQALSAENESLKISEITRRICRQNNHDYDDLSDVQKRQIRERVYRHVKKLKKMGYVSTINTLTDLKTPLLKIEITEKAKISEKC